MFLDLATLLHTNFLELSILPNSAIAKSLAKFLSNAMASNTFQLSLYSFFCTANNSFTRAPLELADAAVAPSNLSWVLISTCFFQKNDPDPNP
ncbi:hypothetical protein ACFX13_035215 [Malus domestica]